MAMTERERLVRKAVSNAKRRKAFKRGESVKIPTLCTSLGLGTHGDPADTAPLANKRRQLYLDLKENPFEVPGYEFVKGSRIKAVA